MTLTREYMGCVAIWLEAPVLELHEHAFRGLRLMGEYGFPEEPWTDRHRGKMLVLGEWGAGLMEAEIARIHVSGIPSVYEFDSPYRYPLPALVTDLLSTKILYKGDVELEDLSFRRPMLERFGRVAFHSASYFGILSAIDGGNTQMMAFSNREVMIGAGDLLIPVEHEHPEWRILRVG